MQSLLKISQQTSWQVFGKFISSLSTLFILSLITRSYGEFGTGIYTLALAYLSFFFLAADFGINAYALPSLIEDARSNWRKILGLRLGFSLILFSMALALSFFWPGVSQTVREAVFFGSASIIAYSICITANAYFQSKLRYDLSVFAQSVGAVSYFLVAFILIQKNFSIQVVVLANFAGWILSALIGLAIVRKFLKSISPVLDLSYIKTTLKNVWPLSATLLLNVVYFRLDVFILSAIKGFSEVGIYSLAYSVFQAILVLPTFIMNSLYPAMIDTYVSNKAKFRLMLLRAGLAILGLSIVTTALIFILSGYVIDIIGGMDAFEGSRRALRILSLGFPAYFISAILMWALVVMGRYKTILIIYGAGLVFNFLTNIYFIPMFGYLAPAYITGISEYLILALQTIILYKLLNKNDGSDH